MKQVNKYTHRRSRLIRGLYTGLLTVIALAGFQACSSDEQDIPNIVNGSEVSNNVSFILKNTPADVMNNIQLYAFDENVSYSHAPTITRIEDTIYTILKTRTWNLMLVSSINGNINSKYFHLPEVRKDIHTLKMWQTGLLLGDSLLDKMPELLYDSIANVKVVKDTTRENSTLSRNVAKIQVIIDYSGFDPNEITSPTYANDRFVELYNVSTALAWDGGLYPNKTTPTLSPKPLRGYIKFSVPNKMDTVNLIVPAHRGVDALSALPKDTTTQKIAIRACLPYNGKRYFGTSSIPIEIPYVPKMNRIMQINLKLNVHVGLDIQVTVKDWEDYKDQSEEFN